MYGLPPRKARNYRNGGPISGPGTGISDDIPATVPEGSFIMPADSTQQIGLGLNPEVIRRYSERQAAAAEPTRLGFGPGSELEKRMAARQAESSPGQGLRPRDVPVNLSNGEHALSPEQVHAVGAQVLNAVKGITHVPAEMQARGLRAPEAAGISDAEPLRIGFANGGAVPPTRTGFGLNPERMRAHKEAQEANVTRLGLRRFLADGGQVKAQERGLGLPGYKPSAPAAPAQTGFGLNAEAMRKLATPPEPTRFGLSPELRAAHKARLEAAEANAPRLGFGPGSRLEQLRNGRQSFADGGLPKYPEDETQPKPTPTIGTGPSPSKGAVALGNERRVARTQSSIYGTPRTQEHIHADTGLPGYQDRVNAIPGLNTNSLEALQRMNARAKPGVQPAATDAYPDETRRNTALLAAQKPAPIDHQEFNASDLTQQERNDAGDAYRQAWQREAPGGLRRANGPALDYYNAEQQVRGTGITAQRGANGVMEFSGDGSNALPQNYTQGVDLNLANERMARANAIRGETTAIRDGANFNAGGALSRQASQDEITRSLLTGPSRSGRQVAAQLIAGQQRAGVDQQQADLARQRLDLEQQRIGADTRLQGLQADRFAREDSLLDQFQNAESPEDRSRAMERLQALRGTAESRREPFQVATAEELIDPRDPNLGTRRVPYVIDPQTGQGRPVVQGGAAPRQSRWTGFERQPKQEV